MSQKTLVWLGVAIGSTVGGLVPSIFGAGWLSAWGMIGSAVGGLAGIWLGVYTYRNL